MHVFGFVIIQSSQFIQSSLAIIDSVRPYLPNKSTLYSKLRVFPIEKKATFSGALTFCSFIGPKRLTQFNEEESLLSDLVNQAL